MVQFRTSSLVALALAAIEVSAHAVHDAEPTAFVKRQRITTGAFSSFTGSLPASVSSAIATITSGTPSSVPTVTAKSTYSAGAANPSISNAPPLPDASSLLVANFPPLDAIPSPSFGFGQQLINSIDLTGIPNIPPTTGGCAEDTTSAANAQANHWWTCGGWTTSTDVTICPDKNTWGLSYDDGPSPYTPQLLDALEADNLKTTFFIVGSRALSRPDILRYEYMNGHQLSVHTWSHPALTQLTNEEIILELGWTKEVIRQATGVTPLTMRPPYGDIDDRVRFICAKMNLTPIIWTSTGPYTNYDTEDWKIGSGVVSAAQVVVNFEGILANSTSLDTGYIVLAHDLYQQSVELATEVVLPAALAMNPKQNLQPIIQCLNLPLGDAYVETNSNTTGSGGAGSQTSSAGTTSATGGSGVNSAGGLGSTSSGSTSSSSPSSALENVRASSAFTLIIAGATGALAFCLL